MSEEYNEQMENKNLQTGEEGENNLSGNAHMNNSYLEPSNDTNGYLGHIYSAETEQQRYARQQAEFEKAKFEKRMAKQAKKNERKMARKQNSAGNGHGIVFKTVRFVAGAAVFGVIALGTMYVTGDALGMFHQNNSASDRINMKIAPTTTSSSAGTAAALQTSISKADNGQTIVADVSQVVESVMPSIVAITSTQMVQSGYSNWFGFYGFDDGGYQEQTGAGSGIIIGQNDTELLVVTNNHVVEDADTLQVQFIDDETVDAYVKGTNSANDLAVVSIKLSDIKDSTLDAIKIATLGDSDALKVGEGTIAIGNALGYGQSVTTGVVSALDREFSYEDRTMTLIQTDAAINPGNSGGALLNINGEVIGINAAKYSSSSVEGMGFAIPVSEVKDIIEDLMNRETLTKVDASKKGYVNIYGRDVTEELSAAYNAPVGVLVVEVIENGAADKAGIEKSDIITAVNGEDVGSMEELQERLEYYEKGTKVTLTVQYLKDKEYVEKEVEVTLGGAMD